VVPPVRPKGRKTLRNSAPPNARAQMDSAEFPTGSPNFHSCDFKTTHRCFCLTSEAVALDWGSNLASLERSGGRAASEGPFSGEATGVTWRNGSRAPATPQQPERPIAEGAAATPHAQIANSKPKLALEPPGRKASRVPPRSAAKSLSSRLKAFNLTAAPRASGWLGRYRLT
jgi:hypothetical protein